jgi:hypothetical protein
MLLGRGELRRIRLGILGLLVLVSVAGGAGVWRFAHAAGGAVGQEAASGIPPEVNHQGVVTVNGHRFNGLGDFRFALVDSDTGKNLWTNDGTNLDGTGMPADAVPIAVDRGTYSVRLGNVDLPHMTAIPTAVFSQENVVLRIWFSDGTYGVQQLTPDYVLTSVPYAYVAANATEASHAVAADTAAHASAAETATEAAHAATADALTKPELPPGAVIMWAGSISTIPDGWVLCDGTNGTPDLRDKFIVAARQDDDSVPKTNVTGSLTLTGGSATHTHGAGSYTVPAHTHSGTVAECDVSQTFAATDYEGERAQLAKSDHTHQLTISPSGGGQLTGTAGEAGSLPPYYALAFIMKKP